MLASLRCSCDSATQSHERASGSFVKSFTAPLKSLCVQQSIEKSNRTRGDCWGGPGQCNLSLYHQQILSTSYNQHWRTENYWTNRFINFINCSHNDSLQPRISSQYLHYLGTDNEKWIFNADGTIQNIGSGLYLRSWFIFILII